MRPLLRVMAVVLGVAFGWAILLPAVYGTEPRTVCAVEVPGTGPVACTGDALAHVRAALAAHRADRDPEAFAETLCAESLLAVDGAPPIYFTGFDTLRDRHLSSYMDAVQQHAMANARVRYGVAALDSMTDCEHVCDAHGVAGLGVRTLGTCCCDGSEVCRAGITPTLAAPEPTGTRKVSRPTATPEPNNPRLGVTAATFIDDRGYEYIRVTMFALDPRVRRATAFVFPPNVQPNPEGKGNICRKGKTDLRDGPSWIQCRANAKTPHGDLTVCAHIPKEPRAAFADLMVCVPIYRPFWR